MRGVIIATEAPKDEISLRSHSRVRRSPPRRCCGWPRPSSSGRAVRSSPVTRCRAHACGVRGVPSWPERLPRSRDRGGRAGAGVQRRQLCLLSQRPGGGRCQPGRRGSRRASLARRFVRRGRACRGIAVPSLLDSGSRMSANDPTGCKCHRQAGAHPVVRRRPHRGHRR